MKEAAVARRAGERIAAGDFWGQCPFLSNIYMPKSIKLPLRLWFQQKLGTMLGTSDPSASPGLTTPSWPLPSLRAQSCKGETHAPVPQPLQFILKKSF